MFQHQHHMVLAHQIQLDAMLVQGPSDQVGTVEQTAIAQHRLEKGRCLNVNHGKKAF
jgi:hypothetical protein